MHDVLELRDRFPRANTASGELHVPVSVVILTRDEEVNLPYALESVVGWASDVHVVDSGSVDRTADIARSMGAIFHFNHWKDWADQRNWVIANVSLRHEWVLFLDADEQLTDDSRAEIAERARGDDQSVRGYFLPFDFYFLGFSLRKAMQPHLRFVRRSGVVWWVEGARERDNLPASSPVLSSKLIHNDRRGISFWIAKHNRLADLESRHLAEARSALGTRSAVISGGSLRRRIGGKLNRRCPLFCRALLVFLYRLLLRTDVRDGFGAVLYTFFWGLWYQMLIDAKCLELERASRDSGAGKATGDAPANS